MYLPETESRMVQSAYEDVVAALTIMAELPEDGNLCELAAKRQRRLAEAVAKRHRVSNTHDAAQVIRRRTDERGATLLIAETPQPVRVCRACRGVGVIVEEYPVFADGGYSDVDRIERECPYCAPREPE